MHFLGVYGFNGASGLDLSLRHQTFNIKGRRYTLLDRLGGGAFGSVWSAVTPDGNYDFSLEYYLTNFIQTIVVL